jgi:hypothetical protein
METGFGIPVFLVDAALVPPSKRDFSANLTWIRQLDIQLLRNACWHKLVYPRETVTLGFACSSDLNLPNSETYLPNC